MLATDYQVTSYGIFDSAIATTKTYTSAVSTAQSSIGESKTILSNTAVFMGPVQENCMTEFGKLDTDFSSIVSNFNTLSNFLMTTSGNYQAGDEAAQNTILDATSSTPTTGDTSPSGVLDYKEGKLSEPGKEAQVLGKRATLLDVQVDGHSLGQDGSIVIKKGQTVHLKVKIPDEIENVTTLKRTSVGGAGGWSQWVTQESNPTVDKNNSKTYANQREYDWYITGNKTTGNITLSQTALFSIPGAKLGSYKGMVRVRVQIVD